MYSKKLYLYIFCFHFYILFPPSIIIYLLLIFIQNASLVSYAATPTYNFAIAFGALDSSEQCGDDDVFQRSVTQRLSNRNAGPDISAGLEFIVDNEEEESFSSKTSHANKS